MRRLFFWTVLLCAPCLSAQTDPYQDWLAFRKEFEQFAGGPTGMYAIQDMRELKPGESVYLPAAKSIDDMRWSTDADGNAVARLEYKEGAAIVSGPGVESTDLLTSKDRQLKLPNGLFVRVSFLDDTTLKAWLYNPALPARRNFKGLDYFPYDPKGVIQGVFRRNETPKAVNYLDSRDRESTMYVVGSLQVRIDGRQYDLKAFSYEKSWDEIEALILLLKDRTSGKTTYGGGRVVDVPVPKGAPPETLTANLNMAYSFLCAHSAYYNCPLILADYVDAELKYGEKYPPL